MIRIPVEIMRLSGDDKGLCDAEPVTERAAFGKRHIRIVHTVDGEDRTGQLIAEPQRIVAEEVFLPALVDQIAPGAVLPGIDIEAVMMLEIAGGSDAA